MSLYSSFYASLSGLSSNANALSVIGNNLANLNTVGFKSSSSSFQDLFNAAMGSTGTQGNGNPIQIGLGTRIGAIGQNFGQGSFQTTNNVTDLAISGQGFFTLQRQDGMHAYTRAGGFTLNSQGELVDSNGYNVLGWNRQGGVLATSGLPVPVLIDAGVTSPPVVTSTITTTTNLNPSDPTGTFRTPLQVYDSLGAAHTLLFTYTRRAPTAAETGAGAVSAWDLAVTTDSGGVVAGAPPSVLFNGSGAMITPAAGTNPPLTITGWTAATANVTWNLWSGAPPTSTMTGYAATSSTSNTTQNGYGAGSLRGLSVDQNGVIIGTFSNGQPIPLAQVALASFANINGLSRQGDNVWLETLASGGANVGAANQGGRGSILGSNLELSNVDVAEEFTKLIVAQRGYQANGRVVTTSDELLQETLNLKR